MGNKNFKFNYTMESYPHNFEVINLDNTVDIALFKSTIANKYIEYVVARHPVISNDDNLVSWASGTYFSTLDEAQKDFFSKLNIPNTLENSSYMDITKYLFKQEYESRGTSYSDAEIDLAYSYYMDSYHTTFFDENLLEEAIAYIDQNKEESIKLNYVGKDNLNRNTFEINDTKMYLKDISLSNYLETMDLYWCSQVDDPNSEPDIPFEANKKIEYVGWTPATNEEQMNYMLLSRLKTDCDYYLGNGKRSTNRLWATNEREQIEKMKELYNNFSDDKKPEWIDLQQIEVYEKEMCGEVTDFSSEEELGQTMNM